MPLSAIPKDELVKYYPGEKVFTKEQLLEKLKQLAEADGPYKALAATLLSYRTEITKPNIEPKKAVYEQYKFWEQIKRVITRVHGEEFNVSWQLLLSYFLTFRDGKDVCSEYQLFVHSPGWDKTADEMDAYNRIINVLRVTCNPETRRMNLKQVNIERALQVKLFQEEDKQKVHQFYNR